MKIRKGLRQIYHSKIFTDFLLFAIIVVSVFNVVVWSIVLGNYFDNYFRYPAEIWIDSRFNDEEEQDIRWVFGEWERATKIDLFLYKGRYADQEFCVSDRFDGKNVIYKVETLTEFSKSREKINITSSPDTTLLGLGQEKNDTLIFYYNFLKVYPPNAKKARRYFFKKTVMHELGHFLGLGHVDREDLLMHEFISGNIEDPLKITEDDLEPFFKTYNKRFKLITPILTKGR